MSDNEIIKALECCGKPVDENSCSECPYHCYEEDCHKLLPQAIDLINRQQAEIKTLQERNVVLRGMIDTQKAEIERLNSPVLIIDNVDLSENEIAEKLRNLPVQIFPDNEEQIRNEAIKEFEKKVEEALAPTVSTLFHISETLTEANKQHISPEEALKNIRVQLSEKQPICSKLQLEEILDKCVKEMEN